MFANTLPHDGAFIGTVFKMTPLADTSRKPRRTKFIVLTDESFALVALRYLLMSFRPFPRRLRVTQYERNGLPV
jgi:hypothetical protein